MCEWLDDAEKRGKKQGDFSRMIKIVNDYVVKKHLTQKAACEDLSIKYSEYMAAKRYLKKLELQGIQE